MAKVLIPVEIDIDYELRGPKIIRASDSDDPHTPPHRTRGSASIDLLQQVFNKILDHRRKGTKITLTLDSDGFIIPDPISSLPDPSAHLSAARTAVTTLHDALNCIEDAVAPMHRRKKGKASGAKPRKTRPKKDEQ
jgi:hypothetical protein